MELVLIALKICKPNKLLNGDVAYVISALYVIIGAFAKPMAKPSIALAVNTSATLADRYIMSQPMIVGMLMSNIARRRPNASISNKNLFHYSFISNNSPVPTLII